MSIFTELRDKNSKGLLWEKDLFVCILDGFPVSPGHSLIIPTREIKSVLDLNRTEWIELQESLTLTIKKLKNIELIDKYKSMIGEADNIKSKEYIQDAINYIEKNGFHPDAFNHGINDGRAAGRTVDHLHWHVIPRFNGDRENPIGGVRFVFPEKANYKN